MAIWGYDLAWTEFLGILGVVIYISSYFCLQAGIIRGQGYLYPSLITFAATCVLLSLTGHFNLSSSIIQVTYISISVFGMVRFYILTHRIRFNDEEQACLKVLAPKLAKIKARQLLDLGIWTAMTPGSVLTEEGKPLSRLYFLHNGAAEVRVAGTTVATLDSGSLIGEMSRVTGAVGSATVTLTELSQIFSIDVGKLNTFLNRNPAVWYELESSFANQITDKLIRANIALSEKR